MRRSWIYFSPLGTGYPVPDEYRSNFRHLYLDIAGFGVLSGSALAFVAVYAARLGADAFQIGLFTAGPAIVNLVFALPVGRWLVGRSVRPAVFWSSVWHRIFYLLWVPLPLLLPPMAQVWTLIVLTLLMSLPAVILAIGFNALFAEAVPAEWRGHVAGVRQGLLAITYIVSSLLCGFILHNVTFPIGYQIVFGIGFLGAALSSFHLWFVNPLSGGAVEPETAHGHEEWPQPTATDNVEASARPERAARHQSLMGGLSLRRTEILSSPFGAVVGVLFVFHLAQYLGIPLFPLYLVNRLHLSDQLIGVGTALFFVTVFLGSTQLAHLARRMGNQRVMAIGAMLMTSYPGLIGLSRGPGLYIAASLAGGFGWALAGGVLTNYVLDRVPRDNRPAHLAWYNLALNAAILLGSLIGPVLGSWLGLSLALGLIALGRLLAGWLIWRWG